MRSASACITGATSGLGKAYAIALARLGYRLIISGRRRDTLADLAGDTSALIAAARGSDDIPERPHVETVIGDLRERNVREALRNKLSGRDDLEILIHNAGYGLPASFLESSTDDVVGMGDVHMQSAVEFISAAFPRIVSGASRSEDPRSEAKLGFAPLPPSIILVSSIAAFLPAPEQAMYTASKRFLVELALALQPEMSQKGVHIQALCPGFTHTEFHDRLGWTAEARRNRGIVRWMAAEEVVRRSLRHLARRRGTSNPVYIPGWTNRLIVLIGRMTPRRLYGYLVMKHASKM